MIPGNTNPVAVFGDTGNPSVSAIEKGDYHSLLDTLRSLLESSDTLQNEASRPELRRKRRSLATMALAQTEDVASARFDVVLAYVEEYLDTDMSLADLASLVCLSVPHFAHQFKNVYGMSPYRYVLLRRIERAKKLLLSTKSTVGAITVEVGFSSQSRFTRAFTRFVGCVPSAYRARLGK